MGWHLPGGWPINTLQLAGRRTVLICRVRMCAPGSTYCTFQLLGQFHKPDTRREACVWGAQFSSGTGRSYIELLSLTGTSGASLIYQSSGIPYVEPCLPPLVRAFFWLAPALLTSMASPLQPSGPTVRFRMTLETSLHLLTSAPPPFSPPCLG